MIGGLQIALALALITGPLIGQPQNQKASKGQSPQKPEYYDEPQFTVAGMTDYTYRGGHGSDTVLRSTEALAKATAALGDVDRNGGDALKIVRGYQRAAESDPSESNLFNWGAELLQHHAADPAIEVFAKGNRRFPRSSRMLLGLGAALYARGSYDEAARRFFEASDLNPRDARPYLFLGKVQALEVTESQGYLDRLKRFAELQPDNAWANYHYGVALWKRQTEHNDSPTATKVQFLLKRAIELDPRFSAAYLQLGIVYGDQKNSCAAIPAYRKAVEIDPEMEEAHYRLSQAYALTGQKLQAQRELDLYNQLSKKSADERERERAELKQFVIALKTH